jgi:hypothetical protein
MNEISLKTTFEEVHVVLRVAPYYKGTRRKFPVKGLDYPKLLHFKLPVNLDFDNFYDADDYINGLIVRNIEAISGSVMAHADDQAIRRPDGVDYTLVSITSKREKSDKEIKEWSPVL